MVYSQVGDLKRAIHKKHKHGTKKTFTTTRMSNLTYTSSGLIEFSNAYTVIHKPLSLAICIFGTTANALNILILSKRSMRSSTNSILTGLSIAQLLLLINYTILLCFNHLMETCLVTRTS
uniref:G-protein coupled receptors family 1 profile domain-containing protein n=1 Tax=Romanomermis culicivorax TaxID=13658 RepID=A0A915KFB6_ROMCU